MRSSDGLYCHDFVNCLILATAQLSFGFCKFTVTESAKISDVA